MKLHEAEMNRSRDNILETLRAQLATAEQTIAQQRQDFAEQFDAIAEIECELAGVERQRDAWQEAAIEWRNIAEARRLTEIARSMK